MYKNFDYDFFKLVRPLPNSIKREANGMPIINKTALENIESLSFTTLANIKSIVNKKKTILLMFEYDKCLIRVWNDPVKYIPTFTQFCAIATPDFSIYGEMDRQVVSWSTYMNRWLGCYYQSNGIKVIPTVSWAFPDTYDICFSGIEEGSVVCISTIGCSRRNKKVFLDGYNEMLKRIKPQMVIIKGPFIEGISGKYIMLAFESTFNNKKGGDQNGW